MDKLKFSKIAESLRQYRRAELNDFEKDLGGKPVDLLYVDPLPSDAVLLAVLSSNSTFLLGRKGTGKSTVFARAQSIIREKRESISVYIDVKAIYDLLGSIELPVKAVPPDQISDDVLHSHLLRKYFLASVISDLLKELRAFLSQSPWYDRFSGKKRNVKGVLEKLECLERDVKSGKLSNSEIPILQVITKKSKDRSMQTEKTESSTSADAKLSSSNVSLGVGSKASDFEEVLTDHELYSDYSDAIMRSFPFADIMNQIKDMLSAVGMNRLIIFFDDFSEITFLNQQLFVDVVLAPLNNASDEKIKLKIAGYPGRVYYGKIDPGKVDTIYLDFSRLYKSQDIQSTENSAIEYTTRLLTKRFETFGSNINEYFDSTYPLSDYMRLIFQCTFNIPRLMGYILFHCFQDRVSQNLVITPAAIRLAAQKYHDDVLAKYFDRMNRFAIEPFERKLDRHIQFELLTAIVNEAKDVRRRITTGEIGGNYFDGLTNPPASHFSVSTDFQTLLASLEFNYLVTKYHEMRDKDGKDVAIYALFYGLCESEKIPWGYPKGRRDDRSYFVQRCFSYNRTLYEFLAKKQTIRCGNCNATYPMDKKDHFSFFNWHCPECRKGVCTVVNLSEEYQHEISQLNEELMLEPVELDILDVLNQETKPMRANEISAFIDVTYQLVGKRTTKMQEAGYIDKDASSGVTLNRMTALAKNLYFLDEKVNK